MSGGSKMNKLEVFNLLKDTSHLGGGENQVQMQHNLNKLTARERVLSLLDEGTFIEVGSLVSGNGAGVITGHGTINGRIVFVYSYDYTVEGGTFENLGNWILYSRFSPFIVNFKNFLNFRNLLFFDA